MPTQVRIFTMPKSLDETLATPPVETPTTPRSIPVPEYPVIPRPTISPSLKASHYSMSADHHEKHNGGAGAGVTFAHQDKLPKLPIPELESTCQKYLAALKPLQSPREHSDTKHAVREFLKTEGPELNEKLKKYAEGKTSYIEQFCMGKAPHFLDVLLLTPPRV
jgi:carnitine O-acetyltransferase